MRQLDRYYNNSANTNFTLISRNVNLVLMNILFEIYCFTIKNTHKTRVFQKYHKLAGAVVCQKDLSFYRLCKFLSAIFDKILALLAGLLNQYSRLV